VFLKIQVLIDSLFLKPEALRSFESSPNIYQPWCLNPAEESPCKFPQDSTTGHSPQQDLPVQTFTNLFVRPTAVLPALRPGCIELFPLQMFPLQSMHVSPLCSVAHAPSVNHPLSNDANSICRGVQIMKQLTVLFVHVLRSVMSVVLWKGIFGRLTINALHWNWKDHLM